MAHIKLPEGAPGILGPIKFRPETAKPLTELAEVLLRGPSSLTRAERETIAAFTSFKNKCFFCTSSHSEVARFHLRENATNIDAVLEDLDKAPISPKLKALLKIAEKVVISGSEVQPELVYKAQDQGATDIEIHDTVLIAAAFCMYSRYVDGLATWTPREPKVYKDIGKIFAEQGYTNRNPSAEV